MRCSCLLQLHCVPGKQEPVLAGKDVVEAEIQAVRKVAASMCPIEAVLERVALTSSGVVVAGWQAVPTGEAAVLTGWITFWFMIHVRIFAWQGVTENGKSSVGNFRGWKWEMGR